MKIFLLFILSSFFVFTNCKENKQKTDKNEKVENVNSEFIIFNNIKYFNENQTEIKLNNKDTFGIYFKVENQELNWQLDSDLSTKLDYISESFEPIFDKKNKNNGYQLFTFIANDFGNIVLEFKSNDLKETKKINLIIK